MPGLKLHKSSFTSGAATRIVWFLAPDGTYTGLSDETGVSLAPDADQEEIPSRVPDILANGGLIRVTVSYTEAGKRRSGKLLVSKDKLATALGTLKGKSFRGGLITSARVPRRLSFY